MRNSHVKSYFLFDSLGADRKLLGDYTRPLADRCPTILYGSWGASALYRLVQKVGFSWVVWFVGA